MSEEFKVGDTVYFPTNLRSCYKHQHYGCNHGRCSFYEVSTGIIAKIENGEAYIQDPKDTSYYLYIVELEFISRYLSHSKQTAIEWCQEKNDASIERYQRIYENQKAKIEKDYIDARLCYENIKDLLDNA